MTYRVEPAKCLRRLSPAARPWVRLVCFPHAGGSASFYRPWRVDMPADVELCAVQYPGRLDRIGEETAAHIDTIVAEVVAELGSLDDRPLALFGHSMGAAVAHEVSQRLPRSTGREAVWLFVSGRPAPHLVVPSAKHRLSDEDLWDEVRRLGGAPAEVIDNLDVRDAAMPSLRGDYRLIENYVPRLGQRVTPSICALNGADDPEVDEARVAGWADYTNGRFVSRSFAGGHFYLRERQLLVVDEVLRVLSETVLRPFLESHGQ